MVIRVPRARRAWWMAVGVILVTGLSGCGSDSPNTPSTPPPVVPQDVTTTLPTQTFVGLTPDEARFLDVQVNVTGTLAAVSGKIAKQSPGAMKVRTPSAVLGVRGTEFAARTEPTK